MLLMMPQTTKYDRLRCLSFCLTINRVLAPSTDKNASLSRGGSKWGEGNSSIALTMRVCRADEEAMVSTESS